MLRLFRLGWIVLAAILTFAGAEPALARPLPLLQISEAELPPEGRATLALIRRGGPYPYAKDGSVFSNRERLLPPRPRGHYREYTVPTPGSRDRGARRIVTGGGVDAYWTPDHYSTFFRIVERQP
ncbi:MAG: ribonuclease [Betaproteobacteria bacterium]|nr:ribonuclease [Betaproteobacteria bacterium]